MRVQTNLKSMKKRVNLIENKENIYTKCYKSVKLVHFDEKIDQL